MSWLEVNILIAIVVILPVGFIAWKTWQTAGD